MSEKARPPFMVNFAVTRECNLRCQHCYSQASDSPHPEELTTAEAKQVIDEVCQAGTHWLIFDGGEPLMRDDIYELIAYAKETGLVPMLSTNATLLSTEAAGKLKKAGIAALTISIHGAEAKPHDDFCGMEGSWERAMLGISNAVRADLPFRINTCVHRGNLDQLDAIVALAKESKAMAIEVLQFVPVGRGKKHPELELNQEEKIRLVSKIIQYQLEDEKFVYYCIALPQLWVEVEKTVTEEEAKKRFIRTCCDAGIRYCSILYEGTVYPCMLLPKSAGNIREKSFETIWQGSEVFRTLRNRDKLEGKCHHCEYRQLCGGARCLVFEKTGSLTKEDPNCWFKKEELARSETLSLST
jgi:radical SAM protein with 4Fe4S-binding SPASM domain